MMMQPDMTRYGVWDAAYANHFDSWETFGTTIVEHEGKDAYTPEQYRALWDENVEKGTFVRGDTIEEVLAQLDGLDAEQAKASVDRYNELCAPARTRTSTRMLRSWPPSRRVPSTVASSK